MVSRVVLPVLDLEQNDNPLHKTVIKGAKHYTTQRIAPDSQSTNSITFTIVPPSQNSVIDRRIDLELNMSLKTGTGAGSRFGSEEVAVSFATGTTCNYGFQERVSHLVDNQALADLAYTAPAALDATALPNSATADFTFAAAATEAEVAAGVELSIARVRTAYKTYGDQVNNVLQTAANLRASVGDYKTQNANPPVRKGNNLAPRQFPISSVINSVDMVVNGTHIATETKRYIHAVGQYTDPAWREKCYGDCGHHPDTDSGDYGNNMGTSNALEVTSFKGLENPLALSGVGREGENPRGTAVLRENLETAWTAATSVGNTIEKLDFKIIEPLSISPLSVEYGKGMTNINEIQITIHFDSAKLRNMFSYFDANALMMNSTKPITPADLSLDFTTPANRDSRLNVRYYTPQDDIRIPNEIVLPYYQPRIFTQEQSSPATAVASRVDCIFQGPNRRLDQIPDALYLWATIKDQDKDINLSDSFAEWRNLNITFGNQIGILSGHSAEQLMEIAKENGCDIKSRKEVKARGFVLKLIFGKDIPLMNNESAGTRGDYSITINGTCQHGDRGTARLLQMRELYVNAGHCIISPNECRIQTGLLDLKDNVEAESMGDKYHQHHDAVGGSMVGGSFFGSIGKFFKKIPSYVQKAVHHAPKIIGMAEKGLDMGKKLGIIGAGLDGGSSVGGSLVGGSHVGGAMRKSRRY